MNANSMFLFNYDLMLFFGVSLPPTGLEKIRVSPHFPQGPPPGTWALLKLLETALGGQWCHPAAQGAAALKSPQEAQSFYIMALPGERLPLQAIWHLPGPKS